MKKKCFVGLFVLLFLAFVSVNTFAQSSNNEQRLVGTWTAVNNNLSWVFNSDFTGTVGNTTIRYGVAGNKIVIFFGNRAAAISDFSISSDGRTVILTGMNGFSDVVGGQNAWLLRKN